MVIEWAEWSDTDAGATWDSTLISLPNHTYYQSFGWGEFKRRHGWTVRRGSILVDGAVAAMAQCLVREVPAVRVAFIWVPGGTVGTREGALAFGQALRRRYAKWRLWIRVNAIAEEWTDHVPSLAAWGWRRAPVPLGHPFTFQIDVASDLATRRARLSQNWRHNLSRGERRGGGFLSYARDEPLDAAYDIYRAGSIRKGLRDVLPLSDIEAVRSTCGASFRVGVAIDEAGVPTAMRAFMHIGSRADDFLSGVSDSGRRLYANYALTWRILEQAGETGATLYDMGGADPVMAQPVYAFKRGLGGRPVRLVGEWEYATSPWLGWVANRMIGARRENRPSDCE